MAEACSASWVRNRRILLMLRMMNLLEQVVETMLAARNSHLVSDSDSSQVVSAGGWHDEDVISISCAYS